MIAVVALLQELGDSEGGSFKNLEGKLPEDQDLEEEHHGDLEGDFLPRFIQFKIRGLALVRLQSKYQILLEFGLEIPLDTDRACNPSLG